MRNKLLIGGIAVGTMIALGIAFGVVYPQLIAQDKPIDYENAVITMERTACYGFCPIYKLRIDGDGTVTYEGERFVNVTSKQTAQIPASDVAGLVDEFYRIDYFSLKNIYTAGVTDLPTTITSISIDGRTKRVEDYYGAPDKLRALEDSKQWIGVR
jgi:hypothetical protein